jgi:hypothetical protein
MERSDQDVWAMGRRPAQAVDATAATRPGVPREREQFPDPGAHWDVPPQQPGAGALERSGARRLTPVFGTAAPPRLLSGAVRRLAYRLPEHRSAHWMLLLGADRLDVIEHRLGAGIWAVPAAAALLVGYLTVARIVRRR